MIPPVPAVASSTARRYLTRPDNAAAFMLGVSLPVSNALMHLALGSILLCVLWQRDGKNLRRLIRHPLVWLPALMFTLLACSVFLQPQDYGAEMVEKYKKLLYVLPLALFFLNVPAAFNRFVSGFLLANGVILLLSLAAGLLPLSIGHISPLNPTVFKLHITQNFFMALAALLWLSRAFAHRGIRRPGYAVLVVLASYDVLFLVLGRTGYVALVVGTGVWLLLSSGWRQRLAVMACGVCVICVVVLIPNRAAERVVLGVAEIHHCLSLTGGDAYDACKTSMGQRTAFVQKSLRLIKHSPWFGNGAGSFWYGNPDTGYQVNNPHNQYLLEAVQSGLTGLALFLVWMAYCYREAWRQPVAIRNLMIAVLTAYMACHLFNAFLLDSAEGHLFMVMAAVLAGKGMKRRQE
ncbi:O-antigen ligase family protein [Rahnella victoriana]|uniref:O-antigen ligase family protein n=2 Tax=Yersiniaceae TaxID=1903411 RepID=A0ABS0DLM2_9GAMM|nr:O-antigen ligase family protein [Rahnella victoriana]